MTGFELAPHETFLDLVVLALSAWRINFFIREEHGPMNLWGRIREYLAPKEKRKDPNPGSVAELLACHYCISVWCSVVILLPNIGNILLSISTLAIFAQEILQLILEKRGNCELINGPAD